MEGAQQLRFADLVASLFLYCLLNFGTDNVSRMRALNEPKAAKLEEIGAEFCLFKSNAPGLKLNLYEPYVDMPTLKHFSCLQNWAFFFGENGSKKNEKETEYQKSLVKHGMNLKSRVPHSEKFLNLHSRDHLAHVSARVKWSVILGRWTRVQGTLQGTPAVNQVSDNRDHGFSGFCRWSTTPDHTAPAYSGIRRQTSLVKCSSKNSQGHISERHDGFLF